MINYYRVITILALFTTLIACSLMGSSIKGSIERGGIYYSPNNEFKVQIPNYGRPIERATQEFSTGVAIGVSSNFVRWDETRYTAILIKKPLPTIKNERVEFIKKQFEQTAKERQRNLSKIIFSEFTVNGREAYYAVYKDTRYEESDAYLVLSIADNKDNFYAIEVDVFETSKSNGITSESQLVHRQWNTFNAFLESFAVLNPSYNEKSTTNK